MYVNIKKKNTGGQIKEINWRVSIICRVVRFKAKMRKKQVKLNYSQIWQKFPVHKGYKTHNISKVSKVYKGNKSYFP